MSAHAIPKQGPDLPYSLEEERFRGSGEEDRSDHVPSSGRCRSRDRRHPLEGTWSLLSSSPEPLNLSSSSEYGRSLLGDGVG